MRDVLTDVYHALQLPLDPATVGSVEDAAPGVTVEDVIDELQLSYAQQVRTDGADLVELSWSELQERVEPNAE